MFVDEPISPELALVDPALAERLRRRMLAEDVAREALFVSAISPTPASPPAVTLLVPPPVAVLAPAAEQALPATSIAGSLPVEAKAEVEPPRVAAEHGRGATWRPHGIHVANVVATGLVVLIALVPMLAFLPPRQAPSIGTQADAATSAPQPRTLAWPAQPNADYYVVHLLRQGQVVWTSLPQEPTAVLPAALSSGTYTWRVESGFGPIDRNEHRGPIATGTLVVEAP